MIGPFLDYKVVNFSVNDADGAAITTISGKSFVMVEVTTITPGFDGYKGYMRAGNVYLIKSGLGITGTSSGFALVVTSSGVFPNGTTIRTDDMLATGKIHIFRLPESP